MKIKVLRVGPREKELLGDTVAIPAESITRIGGKDIQRTFICYKAWLAITKLKLEPGETREVTIDVK